MTARSPRPDDVWPTEPEVGGPPDRPITLGPDDPDRALLVQVRAGDVVAFETLYRAYAVPLYRFVLGYVTDPGVAEELVQDVLCRVWERRERWQVRDSVRTYLFTAARNRAFNHLRRERVVSRWTSDATVGSRETGMSDGVESADARVERIELQDAIARGIAALPPRTREAYTLRHQHHLRIADVAAVMGITLKGAEMALARATKALRAALAEYFGPSP